MYSADDRKMNHGGKRIGAGRPHKWKEIVTRVWIPVRLKPDFAIWLEQKMKENQKLDRIES